MPFKNGTIVPNATVWTEKMIQFLKDNFLKMTNLQLAKTLNLRLTVTRNKCRELGLKRMELEYWTKAQINFLHRNYKIKGDVEIAAIFEKKWPKKKKWVKEHICKKRGYLKLARTREEIFTIASKNASPGGRSHTIDRNSSSKNMHPTWLAQQVAWRDPEMQKEVLKHPEIIELKRSQILLTREIKKIKTCYKRIL